MTVPDSLAHVVAAAARATERPHITADRTVTGRWLVLNQGHIYPFPSWKWAMRAASNPASLCRYTCICPVAWKGAP